ncbi:hypothetical protein ACIBCT_29180 [Streptosporangium sp. NPDC050855]|uniref:hypothetical protein n=1 Tax=Streptosporangium sp. NPDC050855 TaxID=3366194 RepID=UPI0037A12F4B
MPAHIGPLHRPLTVPSLLVYAEWALSALDGHDLDPDELFEFGLGPLLDGVAALIEARSGRG